MRSLSVGICLYVLVFAAITWGPLTYPAFAQQKVTIGFVVGEKNLVNSSDLGKQLGQYLHKQLSIPVRIRSFASESQLHAWLSRYREVDVAWLSRTFLDKIPPGELIPLTNRADNFQELAPGEFVTHQGVSPGLRKDLQDVFLDLKSTPSGRDLLAALNGQPVLPSSEPEARPGKESTVSVQKRTINEVTTENQEFMSASANVLPPDPETVVQDISKVSPRSQQAGLHNEALSDQSLSLQEKPPVTEDQVELVADSLAYNADQDLYEARGEVVLRREGVELTSDELLWQATTQDASASGRITLQDDDAQVTGEQLQYNMATGQGQIQQGAVHVREGNFRLAGEEVERLSQTDYMVKNGSFTTCEGEIPDWKFSAEEVDITLGGYATAKNVVFHIRDVPVFYAPYLTFPVKAKRESGLLTPWFGYSSSKGVRTSLAWYQVIDQHMDATFYLDHLSRVALGKGIEYRYALANENRGQALYYHANGIGDTPSTYYLEWQHRGSLTNEWWLTTDAQYADKKLFFDEFGEVADDYNRDKTVATMILQRNWQKLNLVAHGRYIKDLEDEDNTMTLQRLPEIGLGQAPYRLGASPVYLGMESYATRFWREEGEDGNRLYVKPSVAAVFKPGTWLEVEAGASLHGRFYDVNNKAADDAVPEYNVTLATHLQKIFDIDRPGMERLRHSVEPKVSYRYIPENAKSDLPDFDHLDRIKQRNEVAYEMANRLVARYTTEGGRKKYRDFMLFRVSQSYDIDEARNNTSGENRPFSDVFVELDLWPTRNISLEAESLVPVYGSDRFRNAKVGVSASDGQGNAVKINYNYKDKEYSEVATDYVRLQVDTNLFKPFYLRVDERYDFRESRELERVVGLEYRARCWSLLLTYSHRNRISEDDDHQVMLNYVLAGVSQNAGFGNGFGSVTEER